MDQNPISAAGHTVLVIAYIACILIITKYFLWVLQSGKYKARRYFTALMQEPQRWLPLIIMLIPGSMLILDYAIPGFFMTLACFLAVFLYYLKLVYRIHLVPRQKFVLTQRIGRLAVTMGAIWLLLIVLLLVSLHRRDPSRVRIILMVIWFICQPLIVALALAINVPIEQQVRQRYSLLAERKITGMKTAPEGWNNDADAGFFVIGITGSYGKTTLKDALSTILESRYRVLRMDGNINSRTGIARTINEHLQPGTQAFVCEMGARAPGDIEALCRMVQPDIGVVTSIGNRDLEMFHSLQDALDTRYELLDSVARNYNDRLGSAGRGGGMFVNGDNRILRQHMKYPEAVTFGFSPDCDYHGVLLDMDSTGSTISVTGPQGQYGRYHTRLVGRYNLIDIMGAVAVANWIGIPMEQMVEALDKLEPAPHRLRMKMYGYTCVIDDTDNSYPDATAVALETLSMFESTRILITPGIPFREMLEEDIIPLAARAAVSADYIILVGHQQTHDLYENIIEDGFRPDHIFIVDSMSDARLLADQIAPDQERVILLENSLPKA